MQLAAALAYVRPAGIVGPGRVGNAIRKMINPPIPTFGRSCELPPQGILWVCTTNDALEDVLQRVRPDQQQQLIFVQNGMLLPWLTMHGLQHNTQVLLYMSAAPDGTVTDGGRTAVCGPYSEHVKQHLQRGGVSCKVYGNWQDYNSAMVVKLLWSSIFWLLSAGLGGATVGDIVQQHRAAVGDLVSELLPIAREYLATVNRNTQDVLAANAAAQHLVAQSGQQQSVAAGRGTGKHSSQQQLVHEQQQLQLLHQHQQHQTQQVGAAVSNANFNSCSCAGVHQLLFDHAAVMEELVAYSLAIAAAVPSIQMARQEFAWRNGWFLSRQCTPQHERWLEQVSCQDLLQQYAVRN